jgi:diacylglycerol kinase (ATP)
MHDRRFRIIYNPAAAQGAAQVRLPSVRALLDGAGIDYDLVLTERHRHAEDLARESASGSWFAVVAAGGDGTANEVLNGLLRAKEEGVVIPVMGVLPIGRGNDFAYGAGIPTSLDEAVTVLATSTPRPIDVGYLTGGDVPEGRYFGNGIGIGFDTIVGFEAAKMKRVKGFAAYVIAAIRTISRFYTAPLVQFRYGGAERAERSIQVSIMNGRRMGGAFYMAPRASVRDGLLDLCIAGEPTRRQMLALVVRYLKGTQDRSRHIRLERTSEIVIDALDGTLAIHADGETIAEAGKHLAVRCVPFALSVLAGGDGVR